MLIPIQPARMFLSPDSAPTGVAVVQPNPSIALQLPQENSLFVKPPEQSLEQVKPTLTSQASAFLKRSMAALLNNPDVVKAHFGQRWDLSSYGLEAANPNLIGHLIISLNVPIHLTLFFSAAVISGLIGFELTSNLCPSVVVGFVGGALMLMLMISDKLYLSSISKIANIELRMDPEGFTFLQGKQLYHLYDTLRALNFLIDRYKELSAIQNFTDPKIAANNAKIKELLEAKFAVLMGVYIAGIDSLGFKLPKPINWDELYPNCEDEWYFIILQEMVKDLPNLALIFDRIKEQAGELVLEKKQKELFLAQFSAANADNRNDASLKGGLTVAGYGSLTLAEDNNPVSDPVQQLMTFVLRASPESDPKALAQQILNATLPLRR